MTRFDRDDSYDYDRWLDNLAEPPPIRTKEIKMPKKPEMPILTAKAGWVRIDWYRDDRCLVTRFGKQVAEFVGDKWINDSELSQDSAVRPWALSYRAEANMKTLSEAAW